MAVLALGVGLASAGCEDRSDAGSRPRASVSSAAPEGSAWTEAELRMLASLSVSSLPSPPPSPGNRVVDDPRAAELGRVLFFDPSLSTNGRVSCASCHHPARLFTDGLPRSRGVGQAGRNAPTLVGVSHAIWLFWDGRRDSVWSQALAPLESAAEMGTTRTDVVRRVTKGASTHEAYEAIFGRPAPFDDERRFPPGAGPFADRAGREAWARMHAADRPAVDRAFANVGKLLEAYQRRLQPAPARFDRYVARLHGEGGAGPASELTKQELAGLRLVLDVERTRCLRCHNGPLWTNQSFHDVGTSTGADGVADWGRFLGVQAVLVDPFNCLGPYSDAAPEACDALRFLDRRHVGATQGQFKTPTLRGLPRTGPYMHDGRFESLEAVVEHYRIPPPSGAADHELVPLDLTDPEAAALVAFLRTLDSDVAVEPGWLQPPNGR
jgi:cytochrome c peroxidase